MTIGCSLVVTSLFKPKTGQLSLSQICLLFLKTKAVISILNWSRLIAWITLLLCCYFVGVVSTRTRPVSILLHIMLLSIVYARIHTRNTNHKSHTDRHKHAGVCVRMKGHTHTHVRTRTHTSKHKHTHTHALKHAHVHTHKHTNTRALKHVLTHAHTHTHEHKRAHT